MPAGRSIPAALLLVAVTAGLFAMHTLGHAAMPGGMPSHQPVMAGGSAHVAAADIGPLGRVWVDLGAPNGPRTPMNVLALCLAVLGGITLLAAISLLTRRRLSRCRLPRGAPMWFATAVRGPPPARQGLILADLSVLRS